MAESWPAFRIGDLVWAKMRGFPWWPGLIERPKPDANRPASKKEFYFVVFFGTNSYSWILADAVKPYYPYVDEYMKCNSLSFRQAKRAVDEYLDSPEGRIYAMNKPRTMLKFKAGPSKAMSSPPKKRPSRPKIKRASLSPPKSAAAHHSPEDESDEDAEEHLPLLTTLSPFFGAIPAFHDDSYDWVPRKHRSSFADQHIIEPLPIETVDMGRFIKPLEGCEPPSQSKVGFIGYGIMSSGIAKHLVNSGFKVTLWDCSPSQKEQLDGFNVNLCKNVKDIVRQSDIIFSCMADPMEAKEIIFGKCGILESISHGKSYVEITPLEPKVSKEIESAVQNKGGHYLEAPVIGSRELCLSSQLVILAAGDYALFNECKPYFETFAKRTFYLGAVGNAAKMSILMNVLVGTALAAFAESVSLAEKNDIDPNSLLSIMKLGPLKCPLFLDKAESIMNRNFGPSIPLQQVQTGLQLALQMGSELIQPLPITAAANEVFKHAECLGYSNHDISAVYNARY